MQSPWFLLRWLMIITACALAVHYTWKQTKEQGAPGYRTIPLMQGAKAVGSQLAGVAVDPNRRDVYAIVGGETKNALPGDFFILWRRRDGQHYGLTFFEQNNGARALCQADRNGQLETLHNFRSADNTSALQLDHEAEAQATVRSIIQALPPGFELSGRQ